MTFAASIDRVNRACERVFGESATLNGTPLVGIFESPYADGAPFASTEPTFRTRTSNCASAQGKTLVCSGGTFRVRSAQPDAGGWSVLMLEAP